MIERFGALRDAGMLEQARALAVGLAREQPERLLAMPDDPGRFLAATVVARRWADELVGLAGEPDPAVALASYTTNDDLPDRGNRALRCSPRTSQKDAACLEWAQGLAETGRYQQCELVLLGLEAGAGPRFGVKASLQLADLFCQRGLHHQAALVLDRLPAAARAKSTDLDLPGSLALHDPKTLARLERLGAPRWDLTRVQIEEIRAPNAFLHESYNANGVHCLATPRSCPFDLFDTGPAPEANFTLIDRATGERAPTIRLNGRYFYPVANQAGQPAHAFVGNLLPLGGMGVLHGVSLLEQKLIWSTPLPGLEAARELVRIGPTCPTICVCQFRQHLYALDPIDGRLLWHRDDLEPTSGLMSTSSDPSQGVIGYDQVLVVFASNGIDYTLYDARDGSETGRGRLDTQSRQPRRALGRLLLHFTAGAERKRLRVWDPLSETFVLDEPADTIVESSTLEGVPPGTKVFALVRDLDAAVCLTDEGRLRAIDCRRGHALFEVALPPEQADRASFVRAFRDHDRFYCNLQRSWPPGKGPVTTGYIISDAMLPVLHTLGDLYAIDPVSQSILWQRSLGNRSVLQIPEFRLPLLVTLCRIRKGDQTFLELEVVDARTGQTLASRDDLLADRLLQLHYQRDPGLLELRGAKTTIRIAFAGAL